MEVEAILAMLLEKLLVEFIALAGQAGTRWGLICTGHAKMEPMVPPPTR
jgi:hypothetical protein